MARRTAWFALLCIVLLLVVILVIFSGRILWAMGAALGESEPPRQSDMIVVIGGDEHGNRILRGAELVREGYAPKVLVSGVGDMYGREECDLAIEFAVRKGYAREMFVPLHYAALNTGDEAQADIRKLRELGVHRYLLVTSVYHSARASRIFRSEGRDLEMHPVPAQDPAWHNGEWWKDREGRKLWFVEALKTAAGYLGI
jgi:uncharacterized SAM-binding protein YcdF (DUF218 family)